MDRWIDKWTEVASRVRSEDISKNEADIHFADKSLIKMLKFMTGYDWREGKVESENFIKPYDFEEYLQLELDLNSYNKVVLLSGGLDSLGGVAKLINDGNINNTIFVTYNTGNGDLSNSINVIEGLQEKYENIHHIMWRACGQKLKMRNENQRTRTLWFLSCAISVAEKYNIEDIYLFENGVVSMNPKLTTDRSLTRTTHPLTIKHMEEYFGRSIKTPFHNLTKSDVVKICIENEFTKKYIKSANTCSKGKKYVNTHLTAKTKNGSLRNCGLCYSCIMRRIGEINNNFNETEYAYEKRFTDKSISGSQLDDFISLKGYFMELIESVKNGKIKWHISFDTNTYLPMYKKFIKEIEKAKEIWK